MAFVPSIADCVTEVAIPPAACGRTSRSLWLAAAEITVLSFPEGNGEEEPGLDASFASCLELSYWLEKTELTLAQFLGWLLSPPLHQLCS